MGSTGTNAKMETLYYGCVLLCLSLGGVVSLAGRKCSKQYDLQLGSSCYSYSNASKTWQDAVSACISLEGGHLAEVESVQQINFFKNLTGPGGLSGLWLGASDSIREGTWVWETSRKLVDDGFSAWLPGEPNDKGGEDCMSINYYAPPGGYGDAPCDARQPFVCQKDISTQVG